MASELFIPPNTQFNHEDISIYSNRQLNKPQFNDRAILNNIWWFDYVFYCISHKVAIKRFLNHNESGMPTMSICRLLLPNKEELYFLRSTFILYIKAVQACSFLTAWLSTNIPRLHLLYNLVKVLQTVASCITSSGIKRGLTFRIILH